MVPQLNFNAIHTTFNHQSLCNMAKDFYLCGHSVRKVTIWNSPCESAVSQFNMLTDFAVRVVTMHILVYSSHVEYDKTWHHESKVNTAAPWGGWGGHMSPLEQNLEPGDH